MHQRVPVWRNVSPKSVRFQLARDGGISDKAAEPVAADAREGKDGKRNALLKLIAGIIGVPFGELRQRDRQRRIRRRIRLGTSIVAVMVVGGLIYTAGADAGLTVWLGEAIRGSLDQHELSVFRRVHSDAEIGKAAARLREGLLGVFRERLQDGWISTWPSKGHTSEVWSHSQALFAIYRMSDRNDAQREFLPALETPFASSLEINTSHPRFITKPHKRYRWIDLDGVEFDTSLPLFWLAAAQGAALARLICLKVTNATTSCGITSMFRKFSKNIVQPTAAAGTCFRRKRILMKITSTRQR